MIQLTCLDGLLRHSDQADVYIMRRDSSQAVDVSAVTDRDYQDD
jgi:hypothetical protein